MKGSDAIQKLLRIIAVGKAYKQKERQREEKEQIQNRDERLKNGGEKQKERDKSERTRSGRWKKQRKIIWRKLC